MAGGRPSTFCQEMADKICVRISSGETTRKVCEAEEMPSMATLFKWLKDFPEFAEQYARAKDVQLERMAEEILEISDDGTNDTYTITDDKGHERELVNHDHINRSRLRVDSRKWLLSKLMPKKYGDKQTLEHTGADGGPVQVENKISVVQSIMAEIDGSTAHVTTKLPE